MSVAKWFGISLEHPCGIPEGNLRLCLSQIRNIEGFEIVFIEECRLLREDERLRDAPLFIDVAVIRLSVLSVPSLAGENEPSAVR